MRLTDLDDRLPNAIHEAERFLHLAREAMVRRARINADPSCCLASIKEEAAAKRASMDLTRALAKLRGRVR